MANIKMRNDLQAYIQNVTDIASAFINETLSAYVVTVDTVDEEVTVDFSIQGEIGGTGTDGGGGRSLNRSSFPYYAEENYGVFSFHDTPFVPTLMNCLQLDKHFDIEKLFDKNEFLYTDRCAYKDPNTALVAFANFENEHIGWTLCTMLVFDIQSQYVNPIYTLDEYLSAVFRSMYNFDARQYGVRGFIGKKWKYKDLMLDESHIAIPVFMDTTDEYLSPVPYSTTMSHNSEVGVVTDEIDAVLGKSATRESEASTFTFPMLGDQLYEYVDKKTKAYRLLLKDCVAVANDAIGSIMRKYLLYPDVLEMIDNRVIYADVMYNGGVIGSDLNVQVLPMNVSATSLNLFIDNYMSEFAPNFPFNPYTFVMVESYPISLGDRNKEAKRDSKDDDNYVNKFAMFGLGHLDDNGVLSRPTDNEFNDFIDLGRPLTMAYYCFTLTKNGKEYNFKNEFDEIASDYKNRGGYSVGSSQSVTFAAYYYGENGYGKSTQATSFHVNDSDLENFLETFTSTVYEKHNYSIYDFGMNGINHMHTTEFKGVVFDPSSFTCRDADGEYMADYYEGLVPLYDVYYEFDVLYNGERDENVRMNFENLKRDQKHAYTVKDNIATVTYWSEDNKGNKVGDDKYENIEYTGVFSNLKDLLAGILPYIQNGLWSGDYKDFSLSSGCNFTTSYLGSINKNYRCDKPSDDEQSAFDKGAGTLDRCLYTFTVLLDNKEVDLKDEFEKL